MLKSKQLLGGLLIVGVSIALIQCTKKTEAPANNNTTGGGGTTGTTTSYTYTKDIAPIITANCFPCHNTGGSAVGKADLSSYANVIARIGKVRSTIQVGGKMRQHTNANNATIITNWIDGGRPE